MKNRNLPILGLLLVLVSQTVPGIDLTHHLETSRVYHEMIAQGVILLRNPYLLAGQQATFTYGIPIDRNSLFDGVSIGKLGLCVNKNERNIFT